MWHEIVGSCNNSVVLYQGMFSELLHHFAFPPGDFYVSFLTNLTQPTFFLSFSLFFASQGASKSRYIKEDGVQVRLGALVTGRGNPSKLCATNGPEMRACARGHRWLLGSRWRVTGEVRWVEGCHTPLGWGPQAQSTVPLWVEEVLELRM